MAFHTEDPLGGSSIAQVVDFLFAVPAAKAAFAKGLLAGEDGEVLDLVRARAATVGAVAADERPVAEQEQVGVRVEQGAACAATKAVDVPSVAGCESLS